VAETLERPSELVHPLSVTYSKGVSVLWIGPLAVLFHQSAPLALVYNKLLIARSHLNNIQNRKVAKWLYENHFPPLSTASRVPDLTAEAFTFITAALKPYVL